jgi:hypothetical protein
LLFVLLVAAVGVRRRARRPVLALAGVLVLAEVCTGHAVAAPYPALSVAATAVHLGALAIWGGGLAVLVGLPSLAEVGAFLRRFSPVALGAVAALVASGAVMAWLEVGEWHGFTASTYGHTLMVKLAIVAAVLALGGWHWRTGARALLRVTARLETGLVVAVVVVASLLGAAAPARRVAGAASFAATAQPTSAKQCTSAPIETASCWQNYFSFVVDQRGVPAALAEIKATQRRDKVVAIECHQLTHTVGREAFITLGSSDAALKYSTSLCNSGYPHGVIEEAISRLSPDELRAELPKFCTAETYRVHSFDQHNCTHGVGHGIATHLRGDVFASTPYCELFSDPWQVQSCYGGVFMQKVIGDFTGASTDEHADDPVWPCDVVPEIQKDACYLIATGRVLRTVDYDWHKTFAVCDGVEANHRVACYESIGRDAAGFSLFDAAKMRDICLGAGQLGPEPCVIGAVQTTVDDEHGSVRASALCRLLLGEVQQVCIHARDDAIAQL